MTTVALPRPLTSLGLAALMLSLSACGGGGAGASTQPVAVTPTPAVTPPATLGQPTTPTTPDQPAVPAALPVTVVAGAMNASATATYADGKGTAARFHDIDGFAVDRNGVIFVGDAGNCAIRRIARDGTVTTLAGSPAHCGYADGAGASAQFSTMRGLVIDAAGNQYLGDAVGVRKVTADGVVTTLAGAPDTTTTARDGTGSAARFASIQGIALTPAGTLLVSDGDYPGNKDCGENPLANSLREVSLQGVVHTWPGTPTGCLPLTKGPLNDAGGVRYDAAGDLYYTDNDVHKLAADGTLSTVLANRADTPASSKLESPRNDRRALTYIGNHQFLLSVDDQVVRVTLQ